MWSVTHDEPEAQRPLQIAVLGWQMPLKFHGIVKNSPDADQIRPQDFVKQQMPRLPNQTALVACSLATVAQMVAEHSIAELSSFDAAIPTWC